MILDQSGQQMITLQNLESKVVSCQRCDELCQSRSRTVFGQGAINPTVMFIGEAPGEIEDQQGLPFVGPAGSLLTSIIEACKWKREDVYIGNILKCRPPKNRTPLPKEVENCRPFLDEQVSLVNPKFIVLLGSVATQALLGINVSAARGTWHKTFGRPTIATFHPAYVLRKEGEDLVACKKQVWQDMKMLLEKLP